MIELTECLSIALLVVVMSFLSLIFRENFIEKKKIIKSQRVLQGIVRKKIDNPIYSDLEDYIIFNAYAPDFITGIPSASEMHPVEYEHDLFVENSEEQFAYKIVVPNDSVFDSFLEHQKVKVEIQEIYFSYPTSIFKERRKEKFSHWELYKIL